MIFNKRTLFILTKSVILGYLVISNCFAIDNPNDTDLIIEGESLENTIDKQIKASGNAVLIKSGKRIEADTIIFDQISNQLEANGNVKLKSGNTLITGQQ